MNGDGYGNGKSNRNENDNGVQDHTELKLALREHLGPLHLATDPWELRVSAVGGRGLFATRNIATHEVIFRDRTLLIGPRAPKPRLPSSYSCSVCYKNVSDTDVCSDGCSLPICGSASQCLPDAASVHRRECDLLKSWQPINSGRISRHLVRSLSAVRGLLLNDNQKSFIRMLQGNPSAQATKEIDNLKGEFSNFPHDVRDYLVFVTAVLNTNAFETILARGTDSVKGLFPLSGLMNHQCTPNVRSSFDSSQTMSVCAAKPIAHGDEIHTSYTQALWGHLTRRFHLLATKQFLCRCVRCSDPTENGTYLSALRCAVDNCDGKLLPVDSLALKSPWMCTVCSKPVNSNSIMKIVDCISTVITTKIAEDSVAANLEFARGRLRDVLLPTNQFYIEMMLYCIGHVAAPDDRCHQDNTPSALFVEKEQYCRNVIEILERLNAGECTLKGTIYFELYKCREHISQLQQLHQYDGDEVTESDINERNCDSTKSYLKKSWAILGNNVNRPIGLTEAILLAEGNADEKL